MVHNMVRQEATTQLLRQILTPWVTFVLSSTMVVQSLTEINYGLVTFQKFYKFLLKLFTKK